MKYEYITRGTCSRKIIVDIENDVINGVEFIGGCSGNTQGVAKLVEGMDTKTAIEKLSGIKCGFKNTSCPDQLAKAIESILNLESLTKSRAILNKLQKEHEAILKREKENYESITNLINEKLGVTTTSDWLDAINDFRAKFQAFPLYSYEEEQLLKGINFSSQEKLIE